MADGVENVKAFSRLVAAVNLRLKEAEKYRNARPLWKPATPKPNKEAPPTRKADAPPIDTPALAKPTVEMEAIKLQREAEQRQTRLTLLGIGVTIVVTLMAALISLIPWLTERAENAAATQRAQTAVALVPTDSSAATESLTTDAITTNVWTPDATLTIEALVTNILATNAAGETLTATSFTATPTATPTSTPTATPNITLTTEALNTEAAVIAANRLATQRAQLTANAPTNTLEPTFTPTETRTPTSTVTPTPQNTATVTPDASGTAAVQTRVFQNALSTATAQAALASTATAAAHMTQTVEAATVTQAWIDSWTDTPTLTVESIGAMPASSITSDEELIQLPVVNPRFVRGDIIFGGSALLDALTLRMSLTFQQNGFDGDIPVASIGTGAGFERFCGAGSLDLVGASRSIAVEETAACLSIGRTPVEFRVGTQALAVFVSPANTWATDITIEQLAQIFGGAATWNDIDPTWPTESIIRFIPGYSNSEYVLFSDLVFEGDGEPMLGTYGGSYASLSNDNSVLLQGVENSPYAIGFVNYTHYLRDPENLRLLAVESIEPTESNIENIEYPLARPLYIYSAVEVIAAKPQVGEFINYYLTNANNVIGEFGYLGVSVVTSNKARQNWLGAVGNPR